MTVVTAEKVLVGEGNPGWSVAEFLSSFFCGHPVAPESSVPARLLPCAALVDDLRDWLGAFLSACHDPGAHRPGLRFTEPAEQADDALNIDHPAADQLLQQHALLSPI